MMATSCHVHFASLLVFLATLQCIHGIKYTVTNRAEKTTGGQLFEEKIGTEFAKKQMALATFNIEFWIFQTKDSSGRKDVESITLFIDEMDGISTHDGNEKDHEIHFSARFIERCAGKVRPEFLKMIYFEIARVFQWTAKGQTPIVLSDGIATYAADFFFNPQKNQTPLKPGDRRWSWNKTPEVISQFLFFCAKSKSDFVAALNKKMEVSYSDQYFADLLDHHVDELWQMYVQAKDREQEG